MALVLACAVVAILAGSCGGPSSEDVLREAQHALAQGSYSEAVRLAEHVSERDPRHVDAAVLQGVALALDNRLADAEEVLEHAWKRNRDHFYAAYFCGWVFSRRGRFEEALAPLEAGVEIRPDHRQARLLLARCSLEQNLPSGMEHLRRLEETDLFSVPHKRAVLLNDVAFLLVAGGNVLQAQTVLDNALRLEPRNPHVLLNMAVLYDRYLDNPQMAGRYYRYALGAYQQSEEAGDQGAIRERLRQMARERRP